MSREAAGMPPGSPALWKLERVSDGRIDLTICRDPGEVPERFPMATEEFYAFIHGADRIISWSVPTAEGIFTRPAATPEEVRGHMKVTGWVVISPDIETHTKLVQAAPWANWVEEVPSPPGNPGISWFVDVFADDDAEFARALQAHGAIRVSAEYTGEPEAGSGG